jgi:hypothetical protein
VSLEKELSQFDTKSVIDVSMNKAQKKITWNFNDVEDTYFGVLDNPVQCSR